MIFRPISAALAALARREKARLAARSGLRSSAVLLRRFTGSNMALSFGANARVLGVDISRPSLAYGQRIAAANGIGNVTFAEADIQDTVLGTPRDIKDYVETRHPG